MVNLSRKQWAGAWPAFVIVLSIAPLHAQPRASYRDFALGSSVALLLSQTHAATSDVTRVHERPALIQELQWRPPYFTAGSNEPQKDSVQQIVFSFFDDQLSRIAIDYDRLRTEGMTDADMIAALSGRYGSSSAPAIPTTRPLEPVVIASLDTRTAIAQWQDGDVVAVLFRNTFREGFRLVVTSERLDNLARVANVEAIRIETAAAPALDLARRQQDADAARAAKEKARTENKTVFRP